MENGLELEQTPKEEERPRQIQELPFSLLVLPYTQMIMEAIETSKGCNKRAIVKHIETTQTHLPPSHLALLDYHLDQMKQSGQIVIVKNNYMKPDPNRGKSQGDSSHVACHDGENEGTTTECFRETTRTTTEEAEDGR